ncbi:MULTISPECIES: hypothetical protein [unclassified Streptomyces]|uniref:hypothetical protein n=1 Tax=unclassified Streptomyces TaxID=2593676 RepID=UPI0011B08EC3|nr:hypothetical protein [Streptomyces sp. SM10]
MAGCGADDATVAGEAVYGQPLAEQFQAATGATRGAGTAAFLSTLTYGTRCATNGDTGLGTSEIVRPVDCADRHDIRVLDQVEVDRVFPGNRRIANGDAYGKAECERADAAAPQDWRRGGRYEDGFGFLEESSVEMTVSMGGKTGGGGTETKVTGSYTCFLTTA